MEAKLQDLKTWLGIPAGDTTDDQVLQQSLDAALQSVEQTHEIPAPAPEDVVEAYFLLAARWLARRNSPDGLVGLSSEFGPVRISSIDRDVDRLLGPYRRWPAWA